MSAWRKVVLRQPDLDTLVAAFVLGVDPMGPIQAVGVRARPDDLADPSVLCLECGGGGQVWLANYDHHGYTPGFPPACVQALWRVGCPEPWVRDLVAYAAAVDEGRPASQPRALPDLSFVISGVRLVHPDPVEAFRVGLEVLSHWRGLAPWGPVEPRPEWGAYLEAKRANGGRLVADLRGARVFATRSGRRLVMLETRAAGGHGALRRLGADLSVLVKPLGQGRRKYTIASRALRVSGYLCRLNASEPGWGGPAHGTIIGSPFGGSRLDPDALLPMLLDDTGLRPVSGLTGGQSGDAPPAPGSAPASMPVEPGFRHG